MAHSGFETNRISTPVKKKIIFLGATQTGKTCLLKQWLENDCPESYIVTIGADSYPKFFTYPSSCSLPATGLDLVTWDTAGQERFRAHIVHQLLHLDLAVLVFDVTNRDSFATLSNYIEEARKGSPNVPILIVANKVDLVANRRVSEEEACAYAKTQKAIYVETSAKSTQSVQEKLAGTILEYFDAQWRQTTRISTIQNYKEVLANIIRFETDFGHNTSVTALTKILRAGLESPKKNDYFMTHLPALQIHLDALRFTSSTLLNIALNCVITVLLALTIVGLPLAYCTGLLKANEKTKGHSFTFFAFGEQQAARALCLEVMDSPSFMSLQ